MKTRLTRSFSRFLARHERKACSPKTVALLSAHPELVEGFRPTLTRSSRKNGIICSVIALTISACSLAPNYQQPAMDIPNGWSNVAGVGVAAEPSSAPFWHELGSTELNRLIDIALAENRDLEAALHRIDQARGQAKAAAAPLYPEINASGSGSKTFQDPQNSESLRAGGSVSYELDLWGRNRNQAASARYRVTATQFNRDALRLVITSDVTNFYSQILSLNDRIRIAEFNLRNSQDILRIIEARYSQGAVSGLEVSQQRVAVSNFRIALASLVEARSIGANALAILLGRPPQNLGLPGAELASLHMPQVSLTPPATLLTARPDIQSVEATLRGANADIGAARAAFFPSLTLGVDSVIAAGFGGPAQAA